MIRALSTALGESTPDYLVFAVDPVIAVLGTFVVCLIALGLQLGRGRYHPWTSWFAGTMIGVLGTMVADVLHVVLAVPFLCSSIGYALILAAVLWTWWRVEGTLSVHPVTRWRRELLGGLRPDSSPGRLGSGLVGHDVLRRRTEPG